MGQNFLDLIFHALGRKFVQFPESSRIRSKMFDIHSTRHRRSVLGRHLTESRRLLMRYLAARESYAEPLSGSILNLHIEIRPNARQCSQLRRRAFIDAQRRFRATLSCGLLIFQAHLVAAFQYSVL